MKREHGFTLIELMIVVVIIGVLAAIGLPNFIRMKDNAEKASCVSNQRNIFEAATLYASDNLVMNAVINVNILEGGGYASRELCECPGSPTPDFDDYSITILNLEVTAIGCTVKPALHAWTPPG